MTSLSSLQYPMLKVFASEQLGFHMSEKDAMTFDQRPFRSMLMRGWVSYKPGKGFYLTHAGRDAWIEFGSRSIFRLHPERGLTAYFDRTAYGLPALSPKSRRPQRSAPVKAMARPAAQATA